MIAARTLVVVAVEAERRALGERCLSSPHVMVVVAGRVAVGVEYSAHLVVLG